MELLRTKHIGAERQSWIIDTLQRANRTDEIVQLLESVLRRGDRLTPELIRKLTDAYTALDRTVDARRSATEASERPPAPQPPQWQQMPQRGNTGFF